MFKKIKALFIEEDPNAPVQEPQNSTTTNNPVSAPVQETNIESLAREPIGEVDPESVDSKFIDILMKAIEQQNRQGFDYLEFKNSLQSLSKLDMDESTRFKSAFAMGKTMSLTKVILLESIQHYISVVNQEESKFKDTLEKQKALQVQGKETTFKEVEAGISKKEKQIIQLQAEIESERKKLETIREEIQKAVVKIDGTNDQFLAAHKLISKQMLEDTQKIKSYIEG